MKPIEIQSTENEVVIRLDKNDIATEQLLKIANRLQAEYLAQKGMFKDSILDMAEDIDANWWDKNSDAFLKDVKK